MGETRFEIFEFCDLIIDLLGDDNDKLTSVKQLKFSRAMAMLQDEKRNIIVREKEDKKEIELLYKNLGNYRNILAILERVLILRR